MRVHGNFGKRIMKKSMKGGDLYSQQISKQVSNIPMLSKEFGSALKISKKKGKKVILKL